MKPHAIFAAVAMAVCAAQAGAQVGIVRSIPVTGAQDMVFDAPREVIYITSGTQVLRWDVANRQFLSPITLGGNLYGIDLSPDGTTLAVTDATWAAINNVPTIWVHLVSLPSLVDHKATFTVGTTGLEEGTWSVAYAGNGDLVVTETENGSGTLGGRPTRYYTAATKQWNAFYFGGTGNQTMATASGNGSHLDFAENEETTGGVWDTYNVIDKKWADTSLGTLLRDVAGNVGTAGNSQVTLITSNNDTIVYTNGTNSGGSIKALDGAYDLVRPVAYFTQPNSSFVISYNMNTLAQRAVYDFSTTFQGGSSAFGGGRTRISPDSSLLMAIGNDGVHYLRLYAPLQAANVAATTPAGQSVQLTGAGSIGCDATLKYALPAKPYKQPAHGTATVNGNVVTYVPASGFTGTDTFTYQVRYGARAFANATMTVTVQ